jgi:hypothetical protein
MEFAGELAGRERAGAVGGAPETGGQGGGAESSRRKASIGAGLDRRPLRQQDSNGPSGPVLLLPRAGKRFFTNGRAHGGRTSA